MASYCHALIPGTDLGSSWWVEIEVEIVDEIASVEVTKVLILSSDHQIYQSSQTKLYGLSLGLEIHRLYTEIVFSCYQSLTFSVTLVGF